MVLKYHAVVERCAQALLDTFPKKPKNNSFVGLASLAAPEIILLLSLLIHERTEVCLFMIPYCRQKTLPSNDKIVVYIVVVSIFYTSRVRLALCVMHSQSIFDNSR